MTPDEFRAALARAGIAPEAAELADLHAAWQRMENGHLATLRNAATADEG